jgi:hypothetical protein
VRNRREECESRCVVLLEEAFNHGADHPLASRCDTWLIIQHMVASLSGAGGPPDGLVLPLSLPRSHTQVGSLAGTVWLSRLPAGEERPKCYLSHTHFFWSM